MKRNLKKALAITLVVAMFALSAVSAFAIDVKNWDVVYVYGVPTATKSPILSLTSTSAGYRATCTQMTDTVTRSVTVYGDNVTINGNNPVFNNTGTLSWKIVWGIPNAPEKAQFKFVGYSTSLAMYSSFTAKGTVISL